MNIRRCQTTDVAVVGALLDEATVWVGERGYEQWPLPYPRDEIAAAIDRGEVYVAELDGDIVATVTLLWDDPTYWGKQPPDEVLGFEHRGDLIRNDRNMSIYERRVRRHRD